MPLPFDSLKDAETVSIAGLTINKYGCLTVAEERAARDLQAELNNSEEFQKLTEAQADIFLKERIITILIKSRLDKGWSLEATRGDRWEIVIDGAVKTIEPTMVMLDELFYFFIKEQQRWKDADLETLPDEGEAAKKKTASTGRRSTGNLGSPTQEKNGFKPKALEAAQSST